MANYLNTNIISILHYNIKLIYLFRIYYIYIYIRNIMQNLPQKLLTPLANDEIEAALPGVPIVKYEDLDKINSIEELLPNKRSAVVIFISVGAKNIGHWFALMRSNRHIYYFDSYGKRPDKNLLFAKKNLRRAFNQNIPYISYLLNKAKDDGFKVSFNEVKYQSENPAVQTCGRWILSRINFNQFEVNNTPENYKKLISKVMKDHGLSSDMAIVYLVPI